MKLLLDQGTPRSASAILRQTGFDAVHTGEIGMAEARDHEIVCLALRDDRIVITLDSDFHALLAEQQATKPSVVRIRIEGLRAQEFCRLLNIVLRQCAEDLKAGAMISVNDFQIRVRRLPVT
jgi:predicted nuclease of predicted toxin-antitoxin system